MTNDAVLIHPTGRYFKRIDRVYTPYLCSKSTPPVTDPKLIKQLKKCKNSDVLLELLDYADTDCDYAHIEYKINRRSSKECYVRVNCWRDTYVNVDLYDEVIVEDGHSTYGSSDEDVDIEYDQILSFSYAGDLPCWTPECSSVDECSDSEYSD